ncbi:hypothetical protein MMC25_001675 [Agyrium rufum]|nr:hypothetical protein [Agyrium rufum]
MDATPLVQAHTHARNALTETRRSNSVAASEEHDLAAAEFANAAKETTNSEALRTLHLLQKQHERLAELLKDAPKNISIQQSIHQPLRYMDELSEKTVESPPNPPEAPESPQTPSVSSPIKLPQRELGSSIASNLASARGIPSNRQKSRFQASTQVNPTNAEGKISSAIRSRQTNDAAVIEKAERDSSKPQPARTVSLEETISNKPTSTVIQLGPSSDDAFSRFYNSFSPWISKLSAPLAFAGLPLLPESEASTPNNEDTSQSTIKQSFPAGKSQLSRPTTTRTNSKGRPSPSSSSTNAAAAGAPDVTNIFSKSALRALQSDPNAPPIHGTESFYVVPTTGGTVSYAGILSRAEREARLAAAATGETGSPMPDIDELDEFVDARENPSLQSSPIMSRKFPSQQQQQQQRPQQQQSSRRGLLPEKDAHGRTLEELSFENRLLKAATDSMARRLHAFETHSMGASMALHESLRAMQSPAGSVVNPQQHPPPPLPKLPRQVSGKGSADEAQPLSSLTTTTTTTATAAGGDPNSGGPAAAKKSSAEQDEKMKAMEAEMETLRKELGKAARENDKLKGVVQRYRTKWEQLKDGARERMAGKVEAGKNGGSSGG